MITLITVASLECVGDNGTCVVSQHHLIKKIQQSHNTHPTHSPHNLCSIQLIIPTFFLAFFSKTKIFEALLQHLYNFANKSQVFGFIVAVYHLLVYVTKVHHGNKIQIRPVTRDFDTHVSILTLDLKFNILTLKHLTLTGLTWPSPRSQIPEVRTGSASTNQRRILRTANQSHARKLTFHSTLICV